MRPRQPHQRITTTGFFRLLKRCTALRDRILLLILFQTGCSLADLSSIRPGDVSFPEDITQSASIAFSDPKRSSVISSGLAQDLAQFMRAQQRRPSEFLFSQQPQKPFSVKRVEQILSGLDESLTPQDIRYLHITHAALRGLTPDAIAAQSGLSRQRVLQILDEAEVTYSQSYSMFFEDLGGRP